MDKLFALLGMGSSAANDLLFKIIAEDEGGGNTNLFYTLQALFIISLAAVVSLVVDRQAFLHLPSIVFGLSVGVLTFLLSLRRNAGVRYPGLKFSIAALVVVSGLNIVNKVAISSGAEILPLILYRYMVVAAIGGTVMALRRTRFRPSPRILKAGGISSLVMVVSLYFILTALRIGEVSVVIPITQLSFIFTAAASFLILREKPSVLKLAGIGLAVASIAVLA